MSKFREVVEQAIGEASMCWSETPSGVFDSVRAKRICDDIFDAFHLEAGMNVTRWVSVVRQNAEFKKALEWYSANWGTNDKGLRVRGCYVADEALKSCAQSEGDGGR